MDKRGFNSQEAMRYLGIKRRAFEKHFRPFLAEMRLGTCVVYDRIDLDRVLEEYKQRNGRPAEKGVSAWAELKPASTKILKGSGVSIRSTKALDFATVSSALKKQSPG